MSDRNYSPPPTSNAAGTVGGGQSEHSQLQWLMQKQNDLGQRTAVVETKLDGISETLNELKDSMSKIDTTQKELDKFKLKAYVIGGMIIGGLTVGGWFLNGTASKLFAEMNKITETQQAIKNDNEKGKGGK